METFNIKRTGIVGKVTEKCNYQTCNIGSYSCIKCTFFVSEIQKEENIIFIKCRYKEQFSKVENCNVKVKDLKVRSLFVSGGTL